MRDRWTIGSWKVDFRQRWIQARYRPWQQKLRPDSRLLQVLRVLTQADGATVSTDEILQKAWPDRVVARDSVTTAIYQLRQLLQDNSACPRYIASEPRRGYRLIASTSPAQKLPGPHRLLGSAAVLLAVAVAAWKWSAAPVRGNIYVMPMQNYEESPVQDPLFSAIESTLLSELIRMVPGRVRTDDHEDAVLRLESMMVACDLGPTLVMRLLDTRSGNYVWSHSYNLEEAADSTGRPTLVEQAASDIGAAIL